MVGRLYVRARLEGARERAHGGGGDMECSTARSTSARSLASGGLASVAVMLIACCLVAAPASAEPSLLEAMQGRVGGETPDGTHVFFDTDESLVAADTDTAQDVYELYGGQTKLVSVEDPGKSGGNAMWFVGNSNDGTRVF